MFGNFYGVCQEGSRSDNDAPWNQREPVYETCPECNGDCGAYYDYVGNRLDKVDWARLSEEDKGAWFFVECEQCEGVGTIEVEPYEPDYDDYD